jgi:FKBP-type peptidyl-prolyl cis-trans isomerase (trigger factor)
MEMLYTELEQLLKNFSNGFLNNLLGSESYKEQGEIPQDLQNEYRDYLKHFVRMRKALENYAPADQSESKEQRRALHLLRKSGGMIFNTFALS